MCLNDYGEVKKIKFSKKMECGKDFTLIFWGAVVFCGEIFLMWHFISNVLANEPKNGEVEFLTVGKHFTTQFHCTSCIQTKPNDCVWLIYAWNEDGVNVTLSLSRREMKLKLNVYSFFFLFLRKGK